MAGLCDRSEASDERGNQREDGDFGSLLEGSGNTEGNELADAAEIGLKRCVEEFGFVAAIVPQEINDKDKREVAAGDASGDAGTGDAVSVEAKLAEDEDVVTEEIDDVGGDQSEGDGAHHVHALQRAANGEI